MPEGLCCDLQSQCLHEQFACEFQMTCWHGCRPDDMLHLVFTTNAVGPIWVSLLLQLLRSSLPVDFDGSLAR